ncbi:hypothetical protein MTR_0013s0330 [Medicago truncatula]|uniref:Uncharacterized protein n=1 Tax=Medicago truncatula TaxID=3880 RepID=A0A072TIU8_MEDTR|nr:hypothetical protein MTR_0013s0330 [Medicago truncatula]
MAQLAVRVRQVERLKAEKARTNRFPRKEKVAYIDTGDNDPEFDWGFDTLKDNEINLAELKDGPPYTCKLLRPSNGKNPEEPKNDKYPPKTYTLDVSKCEEIFHLLVTDGIILVQKNMILPPLEQRKKERDSVQKALNKGRLKFGEKTKQPIQVDVESSKKVDSMYAEVIGINMVDVAESGDSKLPTGIQSLKGTPQNDVEMVTEDHYFDNNMVTKDQIIENMKVAYPKVEEDLVDFLNRCKISNTDAMLCPRCSTIFDKEAAKAVEGFQPQTKRKGGKKSGYSAPPTKWVKTKVPIPRQEAPKEPSRYAYNNNYKGKHPMTKTQWRRYQRQKKENALPDITNVDKGKGKQEIVFQMVIKPATERISPPLSILKKDHTKEDEKMTSNFTESDPSLDIVCNVVSVLPIEYDVP